MKNILVVVGLVSVVFAVGCGGPARPPRLLDDAAWTPPSPTLEIVARPVRPARPAPKLSGASEVPASLHLRPNAHEARALR